MNLYQASVRTDQVGLQLIRFPFANHVQNGLFMSLGEDLQLEYPNRDPIADPTARAADRPHLYVPGGIFKVSPAGYFVATESTTTGHFTCDACLPRRISLVRLQMFVSLLPASVASLTPELSLMCLIWCASSDDWHHHALASVRRASQRLALGERNTFREPQLA
jgi:hypothetical protein